MPDLGELLRKASALVDCVTFDDSGAMIAGEWRGGNGGMLSRDSIKAADALRLELAGWRPGAEPTTVPRREAL